jgi:glycosyltransferase involved in cell wall biosynthesis
MRKSRWKKVLASLAYERENLRNASCLHALSMSEAESFRRQRLRNPIAVVPNGISASWISSSGHADAFRARHDIRPQKRVLLYLSRVTPKKGLPMLAECVRNAGKRFADWELVIAGPNEFHHQEEVVALVNRYGLASSVKFVGPLFGAEKRDAFAAADVFVLPSHSEGWPISVLEALGAGVPVLTTMATPFPELVAAAAGWRVDARVEPLTAALLEVVDTSRSALSEMGARGKRLVASHLSWDSVTTKLGLVYRWLIGRAPCPDWVIPAI